MGMFNSIYADKHKTHIKN